MIPSPAHQMGRKPSMPSRGKAPGLKIGRNNRRYWIARQIRRDPGQYPDRCIPLPVDANDEQVAALCQQHTAALLVWLDEQATHEPRATKTRYDGSIRSACRIYQEHPLSPFNTKVKANTRKSYTDSLKVIETTVGLRQIRNVTVFDVENWYRKWRAPAKPGGPERIDRAHNAVSMVKTVLRFIAAGLRRPECKQLAEELQKVRFEKGGARAEEMTALHATAFVRTALDLGRRGIMPAERARSMAIGVAAQFDLLLRPRDIIGEWGPRTLDERFPAGMQVVNLGDEIWKGFFCWEHIHGWRWITKTSKSKYRAAADFDLTLYGLLFPLLDAVPHEERTGAIIKGEQGLPVRYRSYVRWFRQIARAAGIPDTVWSMDARAGGATEAEEAGADLDAIRDALTHSKEQEATTVRYLRRRHRVIADVAKARARLRANEQGSNGGGTP